MIDETNTVDMEDECIAAANWWSNIISQNTKEQEDILSSFAKVFKRLLESKYEHHWYFDDPQRGCGYRAISNEFICDPLVYKSAELVSPQLAIDVPRCVCGKDYRLVVMFINPGEVVVRDKRGYKDYQIFPNDIHKLTKYHVNYFLDLQRQREKSRLTRTSTIPKSLSLSLSTKSIINNNIKSIKKNDIIKINENNPKSSVKNNLRHGHSTTTSKSAVNSLSPELSPDASITTKSKLLNMVPITNLSDNEENIDFINKKLYDNQSINRIKPKRIITRTEDLSTTKIPDRSHKMFDVQNNFNNLHRLNNNNISSGINNNDKKIPTSQDHREAFRLTITRAAREKKEKDMNIRIDKYITETAKKK